MNFDIDPMIHNSNILVTGSSGFIGSHLVEELVRLGHRVFSLDISVHPESYFMQKKLQAKSEYLEADIRDYPYLKKIITDNHIGYIFHLAAVTLVEEALKNPRECLETNIMGTVNILEAARKCGKVKGIIIASSDKAYGRAMNGKYRETDPLRGNHPYETSKSSADLLAQMYAGTYRLPVTVARFCNIYGEGDLNYSRLIPGIMQALAQNTRLEIRSNGQFIRDYLYVKDAVRGYISLAENIGKSAGEAFNFGSRGETLSVLELIGKAEKILGKKVDYRILNRADNEIAYQSLDWTKAKTVLNWQPEYSLSKTLPRIFSWYRQYYKSQSAGV